MKKVLVIFNNDSFPQNAMEFAARWNGQEPLLLVGIFLPAVDYADVMVYYLGGIVSPIDTTQDHAQDEDRIIKKKAMFVNYCQENGIEYRIHDGVYQHIINEIKKETRFADLLILNGEQLYHKDNTHINSGYIEDALHRAECPVLVLPEKAAFPDNVVIAYDGSASCMSAIKGYVHLFPMLLSLPTLFVYVNAEEDKEIPDLTLIEEFASRHFPDIEFNKLHLKGGKYFETWLAERENTMLISGSFGRTYFSEIFKKNFVQDVLKAHTTPVLVSH